MKSGFRRPTYVQKKTAQMMRQQFANEMMEQYAEDELGYVLAEALGLDGGDEP